MRRFSDIFMSMTGLGNLPVRVRGGLAAGARWTLFPFSSYWRGTSDLEAPFWVDRFCKSGTAALDLGAHFGLYTVGMALRVGRSGQVVAIEPEAASRARCQRHVRMNSLDWVRVFPHAASATTGKIPLVRNGGAGSPTCFVSRHSPSGSSVPCVRLDELYSEEGLRLPQFIKIDVENHGAEALEGAHTLLAASPAIMMSFHSEGELSGARDILAPLGYQVTSLANQRVDWSQALYKTAILTTEGLIGPPPGEPTSSQCHGYSF